MTTRGFTGRGRGAGADQPRRLPPGQFLTTDFPVLSAGPTRLTAAGEMGIPQVVSVGATDMVNFWAMESVPSEFRARNLYKHNENVTLMRTTAAECRQIGEALGTKVATASGPTTRPIPGPGAEKRRG